MIRRVRDLYITDRLENKQARVKLGKSMSNILL